ncbi:hypothetical protein FCM35_KLT11336 [Carex littledalei]|uniref:Uncharacterized protein n=1 Tax=Carex littledalei TaxID=544730 RepID=A0A833QR18_9POAL|nr:hypothetical protein FCM35_KLT11336 [Carex littledalei]
MERKMKRDDLKVAKFIFSCHFRRAGGKLHHGFATLHAFPFISAASGSRFASMSPSFSIYKCGKWILIYLSLSLPPYTVANIFHINPLPIDEFSFTPSKLAELLFLHDPEGILGLPQGGHIAKMEFKRRLDKDIGTGAAPCPKRGARVVPETIEGLVEYFLDTEAREIEVEIARLRPRLDKAFFDHIHREFVLLQMIRAMEDRLCELEAMQKVLLEGSEAYDKLQVDMVSAKASLMKILQSKDRKSTLLEMVEKNEINRFLLALLDENIASALSSNQKDVVVFMEDVRSSVVKYFTV